MDHSRRVEVEYAVEKIRLQELQSGDQAEDDLGKEQNHRNRKVLNGDFLAG
jgi:hypothetical protein